MIQLVKKHLLLLPDTTARCLNHIVTAIPSNVFYIPDYEKPQEAKEADAASVMLSVGIQPCSMLCPGVVCGERRSRLSQPMSDYLLSPYSPWISPVEH